MQLIALHHLYKASNYIEGSHEQYKCIVYWKLHGEYIEILETSCFRYTKDNRVPKFIDPFRR